MTNEKTDNTDEPTKAELHDRVRKLESTVEKLMPSRRDALRMGAAGLAGAAGLGAASQSAEASTGSAGDIGDPNNRPDLFADEIDANQLSGVTTGGIETKTRVFLSSNATADPIPFDSVSYDPDNNFDTSTHEYIVPATGTYQIALNVRLSGSVSNGTKVSFTLGTNNRSLATIKFESTGDFNTNSVTDVQELTSGDSVKVFNGDQVNLSSTPSNTFLSVIRLE